MDIVAELQRWAFVVAVMAAGFLIAHIAMKENNQMSFLSKLFGSDEWRDLERKVKGEKSKWLPGFKEMLARLGYEALDILFAAIVAERAHRGIK